MAGCLPSIPVETPWWQDIRPVVESARLRFGIDVTILRLLSTEILGCVGGEVTYLAEVPAGFDTNALPIEPWSGQLDDHALRLPYAKPGGPARDLAWAKGILLEQGYEMVGEPVQVRTWNLSSIWSIPVSGQNVWLKVVPPFFGHEGALIEQLAGNPVPTLIGRDGCRTLLAEVPGQDLYETDLPTQKAMVELLVDLQSKWMGRVEELASIGLPDWRGGNLQRQLEELLELRESEVSAEDRSTLSRFISELPARRSQIADCGLGDTLVHGDFYSGNLRGDGSKLTLIDWGDIGIGPPLLDQSAFLERVAEGDIAEVRDHWADLWRRAIPGCDPMRASELVRPIAAAQRALNYQMFLDNIEPSERVYHWCDPANWLHQTALECGARTI